MFLFYSINSTFKSTNSWFSRCYNIIVIQYGTHNVCVFQTRHSALTTLGESFRPRFGVEKHASYLVISSSLPYYSLIAIIIENADSCRMNANDFCFKYSNFGSPSYRDAFVLRLQCVQAASPEWSYSDPTAFLGCLRRLFCEI